MCVSTGTCICRDRHDEARSSQMELDAPFFAPERPSHHVQLRWDKKRSPILGRWRITFTPWRSSLCDSTPLKVCELLFAVGLRHTAMADLYVPARPIPFARWNNHSLPPRSLQGVWSLPSGNLDAHFFVLNHERVTLHPFALRQRYCAMLVTQPPIQKVEVTLFCIRTSTRVASRLATASILQMHLDFTPASSNPSRPLLNRDSRDLSTRRRLMEVHRVED